MNVSKPISALVAVLIVMSFSGSLLVEQASAQQGFTVDVMTNMQVYPAGTSIIVTGSVEPTPLPPGELEIQSIDPHCTQVVNSFESLNQTTGTYTDTISPPQAWINGTYTVLVGWTVGSTTWTNSTVFQYGVGGPGQCAKYITSSSSTSTTSTTSSTTSSSSSSSSTTTSSTTQSFGDNSLTVTAQPQTVVILGNTGVELTYGNNVGGNFTALVWMTARNGQDQTIGVFASEVFVEPNGATAFIPIFAIPPGSYQVSIFATTFQGISISPIVTYTVTIG